MLFGSASEKLAQFEADPRHHHRPGLDAAHAVNALFQRETLHQIVDIQRYRLRHFAVDAHLPAFGFQPAGVGGRIGFVEAEFIEVVVAGDLVFRRHCQLRLPCGRFAEFQRFARRCLGAIVAFEPRQQIRPCAGRQRQRSGGDAERLQHFAPLVEHASGVTSASVNFGCLFMLMFSATDSRRLRAANGSP